MKKIIAAALASAALVSAASAAVVTTSTQTITFGGTTDFNQANSFQLFDNTLGTLLSVNVQDTYGFTSTITVTNLAGSSSSGYARTESALTIGSTSSGINSVLATLLGGSNQLDLLGAKYNYNLAPGASSSGSSNVTANSSGFYTTSTAGDLAAFSAAGGGLGNVTASTFTSTVQQNTGGNSSSSQTTNGNGTFQIFYTYDNTPAVPEPATWAMMLSGFALVGYGMRRKGVSVAFN